MKKIAKIFLAASLISSAAVQETAAVEPAFGPDGTYMFARRDSCDLFMDLYRPAKGSITTINGITKPTIMFVFGGGFITGRRDDKGYMGWYRELTENGYTVVAIDYRLGLKGSDKVGIAQVNVLDKAIHMAVEDLFSATSFIIDNKDEFGIDPDNIVVSGSSAGAITVLQADYEMSNATACTKVLPEGFRYAGVMSFSGAILSRNGKLKYPGGACPTLLLHGTADKLVNYKQIKVFNLGFFGSDKIAGRLEKFNQPYCIIRFTDHQHEIASSMGYTVDEQILFLENNVMGKAGVRADMTVDDPRIKFPKGWSQSRKELYGKKKD